MRKLTAIVALLAATLAHAQTRAVDFDDCESNLSRLARVARGSDNSIRSESDLRQAQSDLNDIENWLNKAKRACSGEVSPIEMCNRLTNLSQVQGKKAALDFCRGGFGLMNPWFCESCLGK